MQISIWTKRRRAGRCAASRRRLLGLQEKRMGHCECDVTGRSGTAPVRLAALAAVLLLAGCGRQPAPSAPGRPVIALPVQAVDASAAAQFPGEVHSRYEMPLSFRVAGQVAARFARLGDTVKQGQALAKLDDTDALKTRASAQSALDAAEHRLTFATQQRDRDQGRAAGELVSQLQLGQRGGGA